MPRYQVELDVYRGPIELLLYLVRRREVDASSIRVGTLAEQYVRHLAEVVQLDFDEIGEFLVVCSTLAEIKSEQVLPQAPVAEAEAAAEEPTALVRQLVEYRKFREAASVLEERSLRWRRRMTRVANDLPPADRSLADEPIEELELWDLVTAFSRLSVDNQVAPGTSIVYDDTPIEVHMRNIRTALELHGRVALGDLFVPGSTKGRLVGMFLAVLELVRHHDVRTEQEDDFGEIWVVQGPPGSSAAASGAPAAAVPLPGPSPPSSAPAAAAKKTAASKKPAPEPKAPPKEDSPWDDE